MSINIKASITRKKILKVQHRLDLEDGYAVEILILPGRANGDCDRDGDVHV
jgi:hypothetical protein